MYKTSLFILIAIVGLTSSLKLFAQEQIQFGIDSNEKVVKAMTLEEKARFVVGTSKMNPLPPPPASGTEKISTEVIDKNSPNTYSTKIKSVVLPVTAMKFLVWEFNLSYLLMVRLVLELCQKGNQIGIKHITPVLFPFLHCWHHHRM